MSLPGTPTFVANQILTAAHLQQLVDAVVDKHDGAIGPEDLVWPLVAAGNIDMADYELLNVPKFWDVYNLAERTSAQSVQDVLDLCDGGGVAFIPPNTSIAGDALTIHPNTILLGCGESSELVAPATASDHLLANDAAEDSHIWIMNVRFDGDAVGSGVYSGLALERAYNVHVVRCHFSGFMAAQLLVTNDGTPGQESREVYVDRCEFDQPGAAVAQLRFDDVDGLYVSGCRFYDPEDRAIYSLVANTNQVIRDVYITHNRFYCDLSNVTNAAIDIQGGFNPDATTLGKRNSLYIEYNTLKGNNQNSHARIAVHQWGEFRVNSNKIRDCESTYPSIQIQDAMLFACDSNEITQVHGDGIVIGSTGDYHAYDVPRGTNPCSEFSCSRNRLYGIHFAGIVLLGTVYTVDGNRIYNVSQETTTRYHGIEFWNVIAAYVFVSAVVTNNVSVDSTAAAPVQGAGATTYQGLGYGSVQFSDIGGAGNSTDFLFLGNDLPGWDQAVADWTPDVGNRVIDATQGGGNNIT